MNIAPLIEYFAGVRGQMIPPAALSDRRFLAALLTAREPGPIPAEVNAQLDTLLSKDAQIELLEVAFRRPSRTDIKVSEHVGLPELADIKVFPFDEAEAAKARESFLAEWAALPKAGDVE